MSKLTEAALKIARFQAFLDQASKFTPQGSADEVAKATARQMIIASAISRARDEYRILMEESSADDLMAEAMTLS